MEESDRNSFGSTVCHLTKKAKTLNALLCFAYRLSLPKSPPQSYRSYTEFAALPRPRQFLPVTCLVYLRCTCPSDARALSCKHPQCRFWFPGFKSLSDFFGCIHRGDYGGAAGVVTAILIWLVLFYFVVPALRCGFNVYTAPLTKQ